VEIKINDYPVNFELENETSTKEVVEAISDWARERDLIFYEIFINGDRHTVESVPDLGIENIGVVNCVVRSRADIVFSSIDEAGSYCSRASAFIAGALESESLKISELQDLAAGMEWIIEITTSIVQLLGIDPAGIRYRDTDVNSFMEGLAGFRDSLSGITEVEKGLALLSEQSGLFNSLKEILKAFILTEEMKTLVVRSIDSPDVIISTLQSAKDALPEQVQNLEDAAIAFQTGNDSDGSGRLNSFIDYIYIYIRTCYQTIPVFSVDLSSIECDGISLEDKNMELHDLLDQTREVMENNDIISLSDILEYEIKPSLENLEGYIELLLQKIAGN